MFGVDKGARDVTASGELIAALGPFFEQARFQPPPIDLAIALADGHAAYRGGSRAPHICPLKAEVSTPTRGSRGAHFGTLIAPVAFVILLIFGLSTCTWAQTPQPMPPGPPPNPARPALTPVNHADENFSFLANPAYRTDPWDPLKYQPLNQNGDYYLTYWLENRSEYEWFQNQMWGQGPQTISGIGFNGSFLRSP